VFRANFHLAEVVSVKFATHQWLCAVLCDISKQAVNLSVHQGGVCPVPGLHKCWTQKPASLKSEYHAIMNKYPEAASVVQQVYKMLSDNENLARCTLAKVGKAQSRPLLEIA
jgi:hypothetical protein